MKAWVVREKYKFYSAVVFAETSGKAKSIASGIDGFEHADFCHLEVRRVPRMDKYYKNGKIELDWSNQQDRIALVKYCGFYCERVEIEECKNCQAREFCSNWEESEE